MRVSLPASAKTARPQTPTYPPPCRGRKSLAAHREQRLSVDLPLRPGKISSVDLAENNVDRAEDRGDVREHVAAREEIHRLQVREARRANLALVGPVAAVGDEVHAELALGRLDRGVDF